MGAAACLQLECFVMIFRNRSALVKTYSFGDGSGNTTHQEIENKGRLQFAVLWSSFFFAHFYIINYSQPW